MNTLFFRVMTTVVAIAASTVSSLAQTRTIEREFSEYDALSISSDFKVSMVESKDGAYTAKLNVDDVFESYVECYVKAKTLYIGLDEKSVPKDLRKQFKGKNSSGPVLEAVVYIPELKSVELKDASTFSSQSEIVADGFKLDLTGESSISNLIVSAKEISLKVSKKAKLTSSSAKATDLTISADGNGEMTLEYSAKKLEVKNEGSASLTLNGDCDKATVNTSNSSKTFISGKASSLKVQGGGGTSLGGSSLVDAGSLAVKDAAVAVNSAEVKVNSENTLSMDLGKGSKLTFKGDPIITIVGIQNSSVAHE